MSVSEVWMEMRGAIRRLSRAPGFAVIVALTLALGVGANTAVFTVLDAVLLEELPYEQPDRLVRVYEGWTEDPTALQFLRAPMVSEYRQWADVFASFAALYTYRETGADLTDGEVPRRVNVLRATAGYFETLGVAPAFGRTFRDDESFGPGESVSTSAPISGVAILSDRIWNDQYGGDPSILGRVVELDGNPYEVIGIMPRHFTNPFGPDVDVWIPQDLRPGGSNSFGNYYLSAIARLADGVTIEQARERVAVLSAAFAEREPAAANAVPRLFPLQDDVVGETRARMLWILAAAALLVLVAACVNVSNLLIARGLEQDRQLALRSALGSGRARLMVGILMENGVLAAVGGALGLGIGWFGVRALSLIAPDALPQVADISMGWRVFVFALGVTTFALLVFGFAPAARLSRTAPAEVLRSGSRSATASRFARRLRDTLVVAQIAAALVLVAGATLLTRSLQALTDVPLAVTDQGVLTFEVHLPGTRYPDGASRHLFHERLHDRVATLPGVQAVGATSWLPVNGRYHIWGFQWTPPGEAADDEAWNSSDVRVIAGDYFGAMGIEVIRGVSPAEVDYDAELVAWVGETVVDQVFGDVDPLGQMIAMNGDLRRIVGVVEDVPWNARGESAAKVYLPHAQFADNRNWALIQTVRAGGDLAALHGSIAEQLAQVDPQLVLYRPEPFAGHLERVRAQDRFATLLMGAFAALALILSVLGTYGVIAGGVAARTREFGVRLALGADPRALHSMVLRSAARLTIPGVAIGLVAAWIGSRWIETLLFGVGAGDPVAYAGALTTFIAVGLIAAWIPARRATRVDTVTALGAE